MVYRLQDPDSFYADLPGLAERRSKSPDEQFWPSTQKIYTVEAIKNVMLSCRREDLGIASSVPGIGIYLRGGLYAFPERDFDPFMP